MRTLFTLALVCALAAPGAAGQKPVQPSWPSAAVFYRIYPSSFPGSD